MKTDSELQELDDLKAESSRIRYAAMSMIYIILAKH